LCVLKKTDFGVRMLYANLWLFKDLLGGLMTKHPLTNTIVRTSTGLVRFNSGIKVLFFRSRACAVVGCSFHACAVLDTGINQLRMRRTDRNE
jgi:hypothetical protein